MSSELIHGFILYVNERPTKSISPTLEEAQAAAQEFMTNKPMLRIQTTSTDHRYPSPIEVWNYDYNISAWVPRVLR